MKRTKALESTAYHEAGHAVAAHPCQPVGAHPVFGPQRRRDPVAQSIEDPAMKLGGMQKRERQGHGRVRVGRAPVSGALPSYRQTAKVQLPAIISDCRTITSACLIEAISTSRPL